MRLKKVIAAATIPAMVASPVAAANPAASLSLRGDSGESGGGNANAATADSTAVAAAQPYAAEGAASGLSSPLLIGGLAVLLVIIGAVALGSGHHGSNPASA
jgi:hypothetical protein